MDLSLLQAFTISDDHNAQEEVWERLSDWNRRPGNVRQLLSNGTVSASDKRVQFVGLDEYLAAGGTTKQDLFADEETGDGIYICDIALLNDLAQTKPEATANQVKGDGWKWVNIQPDDQHDEVTKHRRVHAKPLPLAPKQAAELEALEEQQRNLSQEMDEAIERKFGFRPAREVTKQDLQEWLNELATGDPENPRKSKSYLGQLILHLRTMFAEAVEEGQLPHDPAKRLVRPKTKKANQRHLTLIECERLLAACDGRDHLILRLFLVCGLRAGELFALRVNDLEPGALGSDGHLRIDEQLHEARAVDHTKTEDSTGWVACPAGLMSEIQRWIVAREIADYPDEYLFRSRHGSPIHTGNYLRRDLKRIAKVAKIEGLNHQVLRRTIATTSRSTATSKTPRGT